MSTDEIDHPEPEQQPRAWVVLCDCGYDSGRVTRQRTAWKLAAGHEQHCELDQPRPRVQADDYIADGGTQDVPQTDEHGELDSAEGMPGSSAGPTGGDAIGGHNYDPDIPDAAICLRVAADLAEQGDGDGAEHQAREAIRLLNDQPALGESQEGP